MENSFDSNDNLLTTLIYDLNGNLSTREEHTRKEAGVELVSIYDSEGSLSSTQSITYDEHGNMLTSETCDAAGALTLRITYTYEKFEVPTK